MREKRQIPANGRTAWQRRDDSVPRDSGEDPLDGDQKIGSAVASAESIAGRNGSESLRHLAEWIQQLQDEDRGRIARDLHDGTAQLLAGLKMNLAIANAEAELLSPQARRAVADSIALTDRCLREIRTAAYLLHPPELDGGLWRALAEYVDGYVQRSGIRVDLAMPPDLGRLPREVEAALFRIVQEALSNIYRHSRSATAGIRLVRDTSTITMEIGDKGRGMKTPKRSEEPAAAPGVGIASMLERAKRLGGLLDIRSAGRGTKVRVVLPLPSGEHR
jgi:signal transduction histidine kinase